MQALVEHLSTPCVVVTTLDSEAFQAHWRAPVLHWSTVPNRSVLAKGRLLLRHIRNTGALIRVARHLDVKIIHIQGIEPISLGLFLPFIRNRFQLLLSVHNVLPHRPYACFTSRLEPQLWGFIYRQADALCVFSQYGARKLMHEFGIGARRIHLIPMGCHESLPVPEPSRREAPEHPTFLMFGGYRPNKGFGIMVDAFLAAKAAGLPGRLCVAGRYPVEIEMTLAFRFREAGFASCLEFSNRFITEDEIDGMMRSVDVMLLPYTRFESQSGILFLAYAYNIPLVASRVGGLTEVIEADGTGVLVEPDSVQDLSRGLFEVVSRWDHFVSIKPAQLLTSRYSWDRIGQLTDTLYAQLLGLHHSQRNAR